MSEFKVEIVQVGELKPHPGADTLDTTKVFDYPVIVKRGAFKQGDLAAYVPVDAVVPVKPEWQWLIEGAEDTRHRRIKAKRLRGIYSEGLLIPISEEYFGNSDIPVTKGDISVGLDVADILGITKYEPPALKTIGSAHIGTKQKKAQVEVIGMPKYTDLDNIRRYPNELVTGEEVVIMEKIHGSNARYGFMKTTRPPIAWWEKGLNWAFGYRPKPEERFVVGSHNTIRWTDESARGDWHAQADSNIWHKAAKIWKLAEVTARYPGFVFFGEVFGDVQDLKYGATPGSGQVDFRLFDIYDSNEGRYLDSQELVILANSVGLLLPKVLYRGPWDPEQLPLWRDGQTCEKVIRGIGAVSTPTHMREGCVIRPVKERVGACGRVILKAISPQYLLRKGGTEGKE